MILITGGARVGKTKLAINLCKKAGPSVLYLATSKPSNDFFEKEIVRRSRKQRPFNWNVREAFLGLDAILDEEGAKYNAILIENIRVLVSNLMDYFGQDIEWTDLRSLTREIVEEINRIILAARRLNSLVVFVTNEVNVHSPDATEAFKAQMEILGRVNQQLAAVSSEVYWVASGIPIKIKP
ncbi:MAG: bifunctional adenosylcobinamide kinase/adenosylcobinamide-phosphate guanylyltransferase [Clostridiales bacterium]|jgi:adenosylcobinamide kinase/adenosylcobinamide-phosphate guanylyltransferase|nr:bifunctional adenosylcobinamide kinase/adenosylcobinamide-phosphate guanylyltransferase [Clostridiales bacterium]